MLAELTAAGAALVSLNPMRDTLEDFFMQRVAEVGAGARATLARSRVRAIRVVAVNVFRESVRDRVPYNLVLFAVLLIGVVVSASASSLPGRTSRSSRTSAWPRRRCSACSSPSSSASGWCRRRSSGAASTRCCRSR